MDDINDDVVINCSIQHHWSQSDNKPTLLLKGDYSVLRTNIFRSNRYIKRCEVCVTFHITILDASGFVNINLFSTNMS